MFITFEGIDGSGKTTMSQYAANYLQSKGKSVVLTREPGGTELGLKLRELLLTHNMVPMTELLMLFAARVEHVETVIKPALARGDWVVCDRYVDTTYAYQGAGRGIPTHIINQLALLVPEPDYTFYLDVSLETSRKRAKGTDRFEKLGDDFFERVLGDYRDRFDPTLWIDAEKPVDQVQKQIRQHLKILNNKRLSD